MNPTDRMNEDYPAIELIHASRLSSDNSLIGITVNISFGDDPEKNDKRYMIITEKCYRELELKKGIMTHAQFEEAENDANICDAYRRGIRMLEYGAKSRSVVAYRLREKGFSVRVADMAAERLESDGYINEPEDAMRIAELCIRRMWGSRKIMTHLFTIGYRGDALNAAEDMLETVNFAEVCAKYIEKKYKKFPKDKKEAEKVTAALMRYGYTASDIKSARKIVNKNHEDD